MKKIYMVLCNLERLLMLLTEDKPGKDPDAPDQEDKKRKAEEWMNPHEVRAYLGISESTYHRHRRQGKLPGARLDKKGKVYYRKKDIDQLLKSDNGKWKR